MTTGRTTSLGRCHRIMGVAGSALVLVAVLFAASPSVHGQGEPGFVLVVHPDNPTTTLPRAKVDGIYLGKITTWDDGVEIAAVANVDEAVYEEFCTSVHARSASAVRAYWAAKVLQGFSTPPTVLDDEAVMETVRGNRDAIGYIRAGVTLRGVKQISVTDSD